MNLKIKISSLLLLSCSFLFAQEVENALLWEIKNKENNKTSYLYGTMHAGCDIQLESTLMKAVELAEFLILEIDLNNPNTNAKMMEHMYMKDDQKISDFLSDEEYEILSEYINPRLSAQGMNLAMLQQVKPILLSSMIIPSMLDCETVGAYDLELAKIAVKADIPIIGLESVEEQMRIFDRIPAEKQAGMLLESALDGGKSDQKQLEQMIIAYQNKDLNELEKIANQDQGIFVEYENDILIKRNLNWISTLKKYIYEHEVLIGVGALHLVGEKGLINLLKKEGFDLNPVK